MKQAVMLLALAVAALEAGTLATGPDTVVRVVYGALALMSLMIAATFLWLWVERTTPLALGMAFSWFGAGLFAGGWWFRELLGRPDWADGRAGVFMVLGVCLVGAVLHFSVIHRSFGRHGVTFLWPVFTALVVSAAGVAVFGG